MKFWEAIKAIEEGKSVRCRKWSPGASWNLKPISISDEKRIYWPDCHMQISRMIEEEWELYEEPVQLLTFAQVVEGLKKKKKFRRKCWEKHGTPISSDGTCLRKFIDLEDFEATDWIEVK